MAGGAAPANGTGNPNITPDDEYTTWYNSLPASTQALVINPADRAAAAYNQQQVDASNAAFNYNPNSAAARMGVRKNPWDVALGNNAYSKPNSTPPGAPTPASPGVPNPAGYTYPTAPTTIGPTGNSLLPSNNGSLNVSNAGSSGALGTNLNTPKQPPITPTLSNYGGLKSGESLPAGVSTGGVPASNSPNLGAAAVNNYNNNASNGALAVNSGVASSTSTNDPNTNSGANANSNAPVRQQLAQVWGLNTGTGLSRDQYAHLPQWLQAQFTPNYDENGITGYQPVGPTLLDRNGHQVTLVNDDGSLVDGSNIAWNQGAENSKYFDPDLGWVTAMTNVNDAPYRRSSGQLRTAAGIGFGLIAGGGLADAFGLFSGGVNPVTGAGLGGSAGEAAAAAGMGAPVIEAGVPYTGAAAAGGGAATGGGGVAAATGGGAAAGGAGLGATIADAANSTVGRAILGTGLSTGARAILGGNGTPGSGSSGGWLNIPGIVSGIYGNQAGRNNISDYRALVEQYLNRGDPYGPQRAAAIQRLAQLEADPGSVANNPLFSAMQDKSNQNLARVLAARGLSVSGNELGALSENFQANLNKFYNDEWTRTAREAGVFIDPGQSVAGAFQGAGNIFNANNNMDAATAALLMRILGGGNSGGSGSSGSWWDSFIRDIFGGGSGGGGDDGSEDPGSVAENGPLGDGTNTTIDI